VVASDSWGGQGLDIGHVAAGLQERRVRHAGRNLVLTSRCVGLGGSDIYKIIYTAVDTQPESQRKRLKIMVGERGFEPPTPWSRTV
jgi:hypothetical protein